MEGVLVPEIWIAFSEASGIPELCRTTRDEPDYDKLMTWRLGILKEHGLGLKEIQAVITKIDPLPGAKAFLDKLRSETQVIILSDTVHIRLRNILKYTFYYNSFAAVFRQHTRTAKIDPSQRIMPPAEAHLSYKSLGNAADSFLHGGSVLCSYMLQPHIIKLLGCKIGWKPQPPQGVIVNIQKIWLSPLACQREHSGQIYLFINSHFALLI